MPSPKQSGQPSGGMFQKYTGEQINQIPEGYVEGMGAMGKAYASIGQSIGSAAIKFAEIKSNEAKMQGKIAPYLAGTKSEIEQSLKNGNLIKDANGNVVPNEAVGITSDMVDTTKLDLYNKTGGDVSKLTGNDLTKFASSFESAQEMAKVASERSANALKMQKTAAEIENLQSQVDERKAAATYMSSVSQMFSGAAAGYGAGLNNGAMPTVSGTAESKPAPEVKELGSATAFVNNNISSTGAPVAPTATTPATTANRYSINFGATETGVYAPSGTERSAADRYSLQPIPYETGVDMPTGEPVKTVAEKYSMEGVTSTEEAPAGGATSAILAPAVKAETVPAPNTPAPSAATQAKKAPPAAAAAVPAPSPNGSALPAAPASLSVVEQLTALNKKRSDVVTERDRSMTAFKTKLDSQKQFVAAGLGMNRTQPMAKATLEYLDRSYGLMQQEWDKKIESVDAEIKGVQNVFAAEQDVAKAKKIRVDTSKEDVAAAPRIGVFNWRYRDIPEDRRIQMRIAPFSVAAINEMRDQNVGFVKAQGFLTKLDNTQLARVRSDGGYAESFKVTSSNLENWATAELADIFGVATFRKAIVSGGNFSDSDRMFVQKAIAYLNSADFTNTPEVYKAKINALGKFINAMYSDGFKANAYDFDEKGMKETVAYFKENGMYAEAAAEQRSLDEYKSFSNRFGVNQDTNTGFSSKEEILEARKALWELIPKSEREAVEKLKDGTTVRLIDSSPDSSNFKKGL